MCSGRTLTKLCLAVVLMSGMPQYAQAIQIDDGIQVLEQKEITALTDENLMDVYIDVLVEMEASKTFHSTSGFTPKEYKKYKALLNYRLLLLFEIQRRKLELPPAVN